MISRSVGLRASSGRAGPAPKRRTTRNADQHLFQVNLIKLANACRKTSTRSTFFADHDSELRLYITKNIKKESGFQIFDKMLIQNFLLNLIYFQLIKNGRKLSPSVPGVWHFFSSEYLQEKIIRPKSSCFLT